MTLHSRFSFFGSGGIVTEQPFFLDHWVRSFVFSYSRRIFENLRFFLAQKIRTSDNTDIMTAFWKYNPRQRRSKRFTPQTWEIRRIIYPLATLTASWYHHQPPTANPPPSLHKTKGLLIAFVDDAGRPRNTVGVVKFFISFSTPRTGLQNLFTKRDTWCALSYPIRTSHETNVLWNIYDRNHYFCSFFTHCFSGMRVFFGGGWGEEGL